tara:strand:- start:347 stop:721 length:375 start_codon:yes stop_codon:yes gene_type:complete
MTVNKYLMDRMRNNIDKVANINIKKLFYRFTILGLVFSVVFFLIGFPNVSFDEALLGFGMAYLIFLYVLLFIFLFKFFRFLIGGAEVATSGKSDFFKSKEIEEKEVAQKATQEKAKDLEEDLFE